VTIVPDGIATALLDVDCLLIVHIDVVSTRVVNSFHTTVAVENVAGSGNIIAIIVILTDTAIQAAAVVAVDAAAESADFARSALRRQP